jgi:hypothetical protein
VTGQRLSQAGWLSPSKAGLKGTVAEAGFTSSSGEVRASLVNAKKGLSDEERRNRNRFASSQVAQERVSDLGESQLPEGKRLLLWTSTGERLWRGR